jgi:hypothetical protein
LLGTTQLKAGKVLAEGSFWGVRVVVGSSRVSSTALVKHALLRLL